MRLVRRAAACFVIPAFAHRDASRTEAKGEKVMLHNRLDPARQASPGWEVSSPLRSAQGPFYQPAGFHNPAGACGTPQHLKESIMKTALVVAALVAVVQMGLGALAASETQEQVSRITTSRLAAIDAATE
jgi:hypothetical protein